jgi:hypothetical protein
MEETQTTAPPARPKPRPAYRVTAPVNYQDPVTETDDEDHDEAAEAPSHVSPKSRPRSMATYKSSMSPNRKPQPGVNGTSTSQTPQKRARVDEDGEQSGTDDGSQVHGTQSSDIQVRRKRVRH